MCAGVRRGSRGRRAHASAPTLLPTLAPTQVTNTTGAPLPGLLVAAEGVSEVVKSWNCTEAGPREGEAPAFTFGLPEWCGPGGLDVGRDYIMGVIVRGEQPSSFTVELAAA